ncbi:MAG: DNA polymerase II [Candidatus Rokubacteria bacterium]|nr:DNA polymerase II [Candidatus Rokubacteria bacterium]
MEPLSDSDPAPGILATSLADGGRAARVWRRIEDGVASEDVPFRPFLLLADPRLVDGAAGLLSLDRLDGDAALAWIARFESWPSALGTRDLCRERSGQPPNTPSAPYRLPGDPAHQYLLTSGRTSFRGLKFTDLHRLALDIEVVTTDGFEFPNAARSGDRIVAAAIADSHGFVEVLRGDRMDEKALLHAIGQVLRDRDPDVIEGHNIFRFDLEYLEARARLHAVPLAWGRDGSVLRGRPSRLDVAGRTIAYRQFEVAGRHIVDTWMLAQLHDVGARDLPSFGLKDIARHLGLAAGDRTYVDAGRIAEALRDAPDRLMAYAADDACETLGVSARFSPPYFAQAQLVPFDYQSTVLRGAAAKIDALLMRDYLRRGHAVPLPQAPAPVGGGHVAIFHQGVARPVLHVDVTSLYPSVMLAHGIAPASDGLGAFLRLLATLHDVRVAAKRDAAAAATAEDRAHLTALQQSFKILINAFYGYLAFSAGHWNDFEAANRVTAAGREVVGTIIARLRALGGVPIEADTDGVYFVPPAGLAGDESLLEALQSALPAGIRLELDGRYTAMFSYKLKTYGLADATGRVVLKGSAFRSRGLEPFQRQLIHELVGLFLAGRGREARGVVDRWLADFTAHRVPVRVFARTETLQEPLDAYREKVAAGVRAVSAAYEVALASGRPWEPGDQVSYYIAGRGMRGAVAEQARLVADWTPDRPDENVEYYRAKVIEVWERLAPFTDLEGLRPYAEDPADTDGQLSLF